MADLPLEAQAAGSGGQLHRGKARLDAVVLGAIDPELQQFAGTASRAPARGS